MHIMDLGRVKQTSGESLVALIIRYTNRALQCKEMLLKPDLVHGCIKNMEDGSQIFLSLGAISIFFELLKRVANLSNAIRRSRKRSKDINATIDVCATKRGKKRNYKATSPPKSYGDKTEVPPIPLP